MAVARNHHDFVRYLIKNHENDLNINQTTFEVGESPLFFAISKLKNRPSDKLRMTKILLEHPKIEVGLLNS